MFFVSIKLINFDFGPYLIFLILQSEKTYLTHILIIKEFLPKY